MPIIVLKGKKREYMFSVVEAQYNNMPEWGGIFIIVRAENNGLEVKNCVAIGSCSSFEKYSSKIKALTAQHPCTHIYLLPEFQQQYRQLAIKDLMETEAFKDIFMQILEDQGNFNLDDNDKESKPLHTV